MSNIVDELLHPQAGQIIGDETTKTENGHLTTEPKQSVWIWDGWYKEFTEKDRIDANAINAMAKEEILLRAGKAAQDIMRALADQFSTKKEMRALDGLTYQLKYPYLAGSVMSVVSQMLERGQIPAGLSSSLEKKYIVFSKAYVQIKFYFQPPASGYFDVNRFKETYKVKPIPLEVYELAECGVISKTAASTKEKKADMAPALAAKEALLKCDFLRANIEPYKENRLTDSHQGHWELAESRDKGMIEVKLPEGMKFYARPPQLDVQWGAVCAIDFGTKSTVVVCRDEKNNERMLRIGKGNYADAPKMKDYENPTVIELVNKNAFTAAYQTREGRPFTRWEDLTVSHQAADTIEANEESVAIFDSVFSDLKQWAQEKESSLWISDQQGEAFKLPPYQELKNGTFDPIEVYAYYLGLYINNMTQGVYLDYILSYPVTYTEEVRNRICESFKRGLWKALPPALQKDEKVKAKFRVYPGASEPAAYAASALKIFGLQPEKGSTEEVAYAVFDFGGGTTDFDFGVIRRGKRSFFEIEQFNAGGDSYLGGENLKELLAYDVYRTNFDVFRKHGVRFVLPPEASMFAGSETFVLEPKNASRYAYLNNKYLSKAMRPIWEDRDIKDETLKIDLFQEEKGQTKLRPVKEEVKVDLAALRQHIRERIEGGVSNFFAAMEQAFDGKEKYPIHIFLAGNSCRSPIVQELFDKYIKEYTERKGARQEICKLYRPLGEETNDGKEKDDVSEIDQKRTGKTGVAFGLLRMRRGGKDIRVIEHRVSGSDGTSMMPFRYYLGRPDEEDCFEVAIGKEVPYGEWKWFAYADENEFDLYYTEQPKAVDGEMKLSDVQSVHCTFSESETSDEDEVGVYVCKKAVDEVEYAIGREAEASSGAFKGTVYTVRLKAD